jgi:hypothetical protein
VDQVEIENRAIMNVELKGANMHAEMICMIGVVILGGVCRSRLVETEFA